MQIGVSSFPWKVNRISLVKCIYINSYSHIYALIYIYYINILVKFRGIFKTPNCLLSCNYIANDLQVEKVMYIIKLTGIKMESFKGNPCNKLAVALVIFTGKIIFILKHLPRQIL